MSDYHARIMNIPTDTESMSSYPPGGVSLRAYKAGHRDARHAAAEIALEAEARVQTLEAALTLVDEAMQVLRPQCTEGADVADTLDSFIPAVRAALAAVKGDEG